MTRSEALRSWCPFAHVAQRAGLLTVVAVNRDPDGDDHYACRCRAHLCMAWRETNGDGWCGLAGDIGHL